MFNYEKIQEEEREKIFQKEVNITIIINYINIVY